MSFRLPPDVEARILSSPGVRVTAGRPAVCVATAGYFAADLPYPPSINHYWKRTRAGGVMVSSAGLRFRAGVAAAVWGAGRPPMLAGRLKVLVTAYPPDRRRRDIDNLLKSLLDSLARAGVYGDDVQIDDLRIVRGPVERGGRIAVVVEEIAEGTP